MTDAINIESATVVAARLKEARAATGLSTRAVAALLSEKVRSPVSHNTLACFERADGSASPAVKILGMLAEIYGRPLQWFLEKSTPLTGIRYRYTSSRVLVKERHQFESLAQRWLEAYVKLERRVGERLVERRSRKKFKAKTPIELATEIRKEWGLKDSDPVFSVVGIMEELGIRVIELPSQFRIDGLTAKFGDEIAVVLNPMTPNDRGRLNAGHETFHALNGDCEGQDKTTRAMEDRAYEFACNLLIPESELMKAFEGRSAVRLVQAKEKFGISMAAMIYRAERVGVIDERTAKWLWIQFAKRGWRANEPGQVRADRALRFEAMLDKAIAEKQLQWSEAVSLLGVTRQELEERMRMAVGNIKREREDQSAGGAVSLRIRDAE